MCAVRLGASRSQSRPPYLAFILLFGSGQSSVRQGSRFGVVSLLGAYCSQCKPQSLCVTVMLLLQKCYCAPQLAQQAKRSEGPRVTFNLWGIFSQFFCTPKNITKLGSIVKLEVSSFLTEETAMTYLAKYAESSILWPDLYIYSTPTISSKKCCNPEKFAKKLKLDTSN